MNSLVGIGVRVVCRTFSVWENPILGMVASMLSVSNDFGT
jgi:hypothetical protein